jgi:hypothetical protein
MTKEELAAHLDGRMYPHRFAPTVIAEATASRLVVITGASDDIMSFEGAIDDELGACDGTTARITPAGLLPDWDSVDRDDKAAVKSYFEMERAGVVEVHAVWSPKDEPTLSWRFATDLPHATFELLEDDEVYCRGIVISMADVEAACAAVAA